jgi:hypothetical protein
MYLNYYRRNMEQVTGALQGLLVAVIIAIITLLGFALKRFETVAQLYLEQKLGSATYAFVKQYAVTTVHWLEQQPAFKDLTGEQKKEEAVDAVVVWCITHNIPVDHALIDKLIEEAVKAMKDAASPLIMATVK